MWHYVAGLLLPNILKGNGALILRAEGSERNPHDEESASVALWTEFSEIWYFEHTLNIIKQFNFHVHQ